MWRLSEESQTVAKDLYALLRRPSLLQGTSRIRSLIERLASRGEPAAILSIAGALFSRSPTLRDAAAEAVDRLLSDVPSKELAEIVGLLGWTYGWYISDAWSHLGPSQVDSLSGVPPHRTSILGLLSFHHNGYVRHEAVKHLSRLHDGSELRFLLIRQNDWVAEICSDAQKFVYERLTEGYLEHFARETPLIFRLLNCTRRDLHGVVRAFVGLLIHPDQSHLLKCVLTSPDRESCRGIADLALEVPGEHRQRVIRLGIESTDPVLRVRCARAVHDALPRDEVERECERLLLDTFMPVRREAYMLRANLYPESAEHIWRECLFDRSRSLRELARFYLRGTPTSPAAVYREALAGGQGCLPALSGIAEVGDASDLGILQEALASPLANMKVAAIRGIGRIGAARDVVALAGYLNDKSPKVVREVCGQLQPYSSQLGGEFLFNTLSIVTTERAGRSILRMLFDLGRWQGLPFLIRAAAIDDNVIARHAEQLIELWFTPPRSCRVFTHPTDHQCKHILDALNDSTSAIRPEFLVDLCGWLKTYGLPVAE